MLDAFDLVLKWESIGVLALFCGIFMWIAYKKEQDVKGRQKKLDSLNEDYKELLEGTVKVLSVVNDKINDLHLPKEEIKEISKFVQAVNSKMTHLEVSEETLKEIRDIVMDIKREFK